MGGVQDPGDLAVDRLGRRLAVLPRGGAADVIKTEQRRRKAPALFDYRYHLDEFRHRTLFPQARPNPSCRADEVQRTDRAANVSVQHARSANLPRLPTRASCPTTSS